MGTAGSATGEFIYAKEELECRFDAYSGRLLSVRRGETTFATSGLVVDVGVDGRYALGTLEYRPLDGLHTWELPLIVPNGGGSANARFLGHSLDGDGRLHLNYAFDGLLLSVEYAVRAGTLCIEADIRNAASSRRLVEGVAFLLPQALPNEASLRFEFPGNVPHGVYSADELRASDAPIATGLVNPVIHAAMGDLSFNVLFVDEEEKWATAVYRAAEPSLVYANVAAVECFLEPGESFRCGTLYVQPVGRLSPSEAVRALYASRGWTPPTDGVRDGVLYSCHPYGTMDSGFQDRRTISEFADALPGLKAIGVDHVWVLPIFEHLDRGVYHPTDQAIIDPRYGTDDDVAAFSRTAHELGMTLLFDYVPHGPEPEDPLGVKLRQWAAVDRGGQPVIEWNCLSFDMANPDYQAYFRALVHDHVDRFDIDGSRIDCAMGGLTNWKPAPGNRPSSSNLKGGVAISRTIREALAEKGKKPLVTPENFNPVPVYAPYTDAFYDMALYRVLFELENAGLEPAEYAARLTHWLETELRFTPEGYIKLRFLGNHDTVSWVWQKRRATEAYGVEKAKALWVLISSIDGMPMLYQGDEDASIYRRTGPDLRSFFTSLFEARKTWLGNEYDIRYQKTDSPIVAFARTNGTRRRWVAVNLSPEPASCTAAAVVRDVLYGACDVGGDGRSVSLQGYGYVLAATE
ncbi:hypothetical protein FE782_08260 [Paenibacillus antri]|uniref:Glycosyl hydrolase family 13 catalytic domain-containing protein n=1 Tax=Paenibacillus antri TaxID=2582848 RepID=A0A5R9GES2_9BACL|nr:alpha-amylase family glycosyl hydrolase [Paenibacillus antri]TLS52620.1 hypothetical protein FE782_08260 [Paenibacillus antri]